MCDNQNCGKSHCRNCDIKLERILAQSRQVWQTLAECGAFIPIYSDTEQEGDSSCREICLKTGKESCYSKINAYYDEAQSTLARMRKHCRTPIR
ncbi:MAG: hypothetical protein FWE64_02550 [Alphaproteobacteria bacterium]|nr:hypothetical protein [Alphaproteobacteria bacterium]